LAHLCSRDDSHHCKTNRLLNIEDVSTRFPRTYVICPPEPSGFPKRIAAYTQVARQSVEQNEMSTSESDSSGCTRSVYALISVSQLAQLITIARSRYHFVIEYLPAGYAMQRQRGSRHQCTQSVAHRHKPLFLINNQLHTPTYAKQLTSLHHVQNISAL